MSKRQEILIILLNRAKPSPLLPLYQFLEMTQEEIDQELGTGIEKDENCEETKLWRKIISLWDNAEGQWTNKTLPRTKARRELIIKRLEIPDSELCNSLMSDVPLNEPADETAVITENENHEDWVTSVRFPNDGCWSSYKALLERKLWSNKAIETLDVSTNRILNHLTDPKESIKHPTKGLVVGYVQSGKTANYSALIAKAVDAGYRFIVVLSGRTDILRNQTQARLDMELLGWESLSEQEQRQYLEIQNYQEKFVTFKNCTVPILFKRLTSCKSDFDSGSIASLYPCDLPHIAVLKKIPKRLKDFADALGQTRWRREPLLLIDDEADEASVNTSRKKITRIPELIANILSSSDFGQYVGYTATPYANVFIRPESLELFPSDFVLSLSRPDDYMGALEIFDLGDEEVENSFIASNEMAHIRVIEPEALETHNNDSFSDMPRLSEAIDSFILAGAIKIWREHQLNGKIRFKHHTMLINTDRLTEVHEGLAREVEELIERNYPGKRPDLKSHDRLCKLWVDDFLQVSRARCENAPVPSDYVEVKKYVENVVARVADRILIVNCQNACDTPDFEEQCGCWAILIGGSKLSRGYTIEGLTTSYFSRKPGQLDTLVQMARWYGFRPGFKDLVRLYIPRELPSNLKPTRKPIRKSKKVPSGYPLLDVFRFGAAVEEAFRQNLRDYRRDLKPSMIPPFVQYQFKDFPEKYLSIVKPTAPNKMHHTVFEAAFIGGKVRTLTRIAFGQDAMERNHKTLENLLISCQDYQEKVALQFTTVGKYKVSTGITATDHYMNFMANLDYSKSKGPFPNVIKEQLDALPKMNLSHWRIMLFWPEKTDWKIQLGSFEIPRWSRTYETTGDILAVDHPTEPNHREICCWLAGINSDNKINSIDPFTCKFQNKSVGVIYIIPFWHTTRMEQTDWHFLWSAVYPGSGQAGAYRVLVNGK